jgi:hypothetical protein
MMVVAKTLIRPGRQSELKLNGVRSAEARKGKDNPSAAFRLNCSVQEQRPVNLEAALGPVISSAWPVRSLARSSTSQGSTATAPQWEWFTCPVKTSRFSRDTAASSKRHYFL